MPNTSPLTIQKFTKQYADVVIKMMENLSDFFSPETIDFAKKKLPKLYGFLAFEQERVWGFIVYECISLHHAKIYRMGVERSHQHQGIGSQLLQYTENALREQQITLLELLTLDEHPDYPGYVFTRNFYRKHHFDIVASFEDEGVVILKMQKSLF